MRFVILFLCAALAACGGNDTSGKTDEPLHMPELY